MRDWVLGLRRGPVGSEGRCSHSSIVTRQTWLDPGRCGGIACGSSISADQDLEARVATIRNEAEFVGG